MKIYFLKILVLLAFISVKAQNNLEIKIPLNQKLERPKLVVGIVVDQMRYDYLFRFYDKFGEKGFKRLINEGFSCENTHFNYIPTYTAVGHTSIYTGTTPNMHGIISNNWYDKYLKKSIYCVDDERYTTIGSKKGGAASPYRLQTTTVTDELKLAQNGKGKIIGISLKDRAAILPTGHNANAAYWFRGKKSAKFISSSYYLDKLPQWVKNFNDSGIAKNYLKNWNTLYNINTYTESTNDNNNYELVFKGEETPTFPHNLPKLTAYNKKYNLLKRSPFGNSILVDFAQATILGEHLGIGKYTDFLAMSFSSTDYIGHQFGPNSIEIEDTYLRLDKDIERFIDFLDSKIGRENYTLFLTADHAVMPVPAFLKDNKINSGIFDLENFKDYVNNITLKYFSSKELIENISNFQIFLNKEKIRKLNLNIHTVATLIKDEIIAYKNVYKAVTAQTMQNSTFERGILNSLQNGYNQKFSGDILIIPMPATIFFKNKGTSHGSGLTYDTHVPLIFFGKGIKNGNTKRYIPIIDIAPTMSNLLKIENPSGCVNGKIITEVLK